MEIFRRPQTPEQFKINQLKLFKPGELVGFGKGPNEDFLMLFKVDEDLKTDSSDLSPDDPIILTYFDFSSDLHGQRFIVSRLILSGENKDPTPLDLDSHLNQEFNIDTPKDLSLRYFERGENVRVGENSYEVFRDPSDQGTRKPNDIIFLQEKKSNVFYLVTRRQLARENVWNTKGIQMKK